MKNIRILFLLAVVALLSAGRANAQSSAEVIANNTMAKYLNSKGIATKVKKEDNSLNFLHRDVLYWITFDGNASSMLFTLHRNPFKLIEDKEKGNKARISRKLENARIAAEFITADNDYKAYVKGSRMLFEFPVYASDAAQYSKVFDKILSSMENISKSMHRNMGRAKAYNDSIHKYWMVNDTSKVVVSQRSIDTRASGQNLAYNHVSIRNVDALDKVISDYDVALRKSDAQYIQPRVELASKKKGTFKVGVKIFTPEGRLLVPSRDSDFTTITTIDVKKTGKPEIYELNKFGTTNGSLWKNGEYRIEFYEDDRKLGSTTFTLL
ncbi:MAG: hypothetical protein NC204_03540 [Candidatus Amulumruptor caecigallinarius]|nr:hypothetical protein [Candidatus Amulumruptor caecigallinarius]